MMGDRADGPTAHEIADLLRKSTKAVVAQLLPLGEDKNGQWVSINPTRNDKTAGSFSVCLGGDKRGVWHDYATGDAGDLLSLVAYVLYAGSLRDAIAWAKNFLGMTPGAPRPAARPAPDPVEDDEAQVRERKRIRKLALRTFLEAEQQIARTPVDDYLFNRGIALAELGRQPRAIRFHRALYNTEIGGPLPGMVAAITDAEGVHIATHRTWLAEIDGVWQKAPLHQAKMVLATATGGSVRIWRGASGKPLAAAPAGDTVCIAEGIETALSIAIACPEMRVLAAYALYNFANLALPETISTVILCADNDHGNMQANALLQRAGARFVAEGRDVRLAMPPAEGLDWNDILQGKSA